MFIRRQYISGISVVTIVCVIFLISQLRFEPYKFIVRPLPAKIQQLNKTVAGLDTTKLVVDRFGQGQKQTSTLAWLRETCVKQNVTTIRLTITSAKYSKVQGFTWSGNVISVDIRAFTATNKSQTKGGDVFLVRVVQPKSGARALGVVSDHLNGSYTAKVDIRWSGLTTVYINLVSAIENVCTRLSPYICTLRVFLNLIDS